MSVKLTDNNMYYIDTTFLENLYHYFNGLCYRFALSIITKFSPNSNYPSRTFTYVFNNIKY